MKFAHIADCHLGSWRDPKMRKVNEKAFEMAIDNAIREKINFLLIAGDLFNTAVPSIDSIKLAVRKLKELKRKEIPVFIIAGSHDYSPSGKTMLDVLEEAELVKNVAIGDVTHEGKLKLKFTEHGEVKITGLIGKRGGLEGEYYKNLDPSNLDENGYKIFMFHSAISEVKPKEYGNMDSIPVSSLPAGFNYYAGGHVHVRDKARIGNYNNIVFPGPTYPNNFSEIEKLKHGTMVIVDEEIKHIPIIPKQVKNISINAEFKIPSEVEDEIMKQLTEITDKIITIRVQGKLKNGRSIDINWEEIAKISEEKGAYFLMRNTTKLHGEQTETISIKENSIEEIEGKLIKEHGHDSKTQIIMQSLSASKHDGEKTADFEKRIIQEMEKQLGV